MGSFTQRLVRLERATHDLGPPCSTCGGPDPAGRRITHVADERELRHCEACSSLLDCDGKPLGGARVKVVIWGGTSAAQHVD